jgi:hypothetical protein
MAHTLTEILAQFQPVDQVIFEPIQLEPDRHAQALLSPTFSAHSHPFDYFILFFTHALFQLITAHTNKYAAQQRIREREDRQRASYNLVVEELYVFIGSIIYMGIHKEPEVSMYWYCN